MARTIHLTSSCLCGAARQSIQPRDPDPFAHDYRATEELTRDVYLCHCVACRKSSGMLWGSYFPCKKPASLGGLVRYELKETEIGNLEREKRWFCGTCGGHVFRWIGSRRAVEEGLSSEEVEGEGEEGRWEVATGLLEPVKGVDVVRFVGHVKVAQPGDGGAAVWLRDMSESQSMICFSGEGPDYFTGESSPRLETQSLEPYLRKQEGVSDTLFPEKEAKSEDGREILKASCLCKNVSFHITRPDASSRLPWSGFPDLMIPYHTQDPRLKNPGHETWWLRGTEGAETRYLAGTCTCRSCKLASGVEVQPWTFVPRSNIYFHIETKSGKKEEVPLDFGNEIFKGVLKSYESSEGVLREHCGRCGATVFWHDKWRPDLIDVSVGLLDAPEGSRAENWLDWWAEGVSFEEDAVGHGYALVKALGNGIAAWGGISKENLRETKYGKVAEGNGSSVTW